MRNSILSRFFYLAILIGSFLNVYSQNTWVVSNDPSFGIADFDNIQNAIDAASSGDKIYVHGSGTNYLSFSLNKKLHVIGNGRWKSENMIQDENPNPTIVDSDINIEPGSNGSIIEGIFFTSLAFINADSIIFRYNRSNQIHFLNSPTLCLVYGNNLFGQPQFTGSANGAHIYNNILEGNGFAGLWTNNGSNSSCSFEFNSIQGGNNGFSNCLFNNNIVNCPVSFVLTNVGVPQNNIFTYNVAGVDTTNLINVDISTVWNLSNPSPDGKYLLVGDAMSNPAFEFADDGTDVGSYGGSTPYRLSGIVRVPVINKMIIPLAGDTTNMLKVTIKAKSN